MAKTYEEWITAADWHRHNHNFVKAAKYYNYALSIDGRIAEHHAILAFCRQKAGDVDGAIRSYRLALEGQNPSADLHMNLAQLLLASGNRDPAEAHYKKAWKLDPTGARAMELGIIDWRPGLEWFAAHDTSGSAKVIIGKLDAAIQNPGTETDENEKRLVEELAALTPQHFTFWLFLYSCLIDIGHAVAALHSKLLAAEQIVRDATAQMPLSVEALNDVMAAACYCGKYDEGMEIHRGFAANNVALHKWPLQRSALDLMLCRGNWSEAQKAFVPIDTDANAEEFQSLLSGKSCAVVGPAQNDLQNGKNIDAHDLVVRTNFMGHDPVAQHAAMIGKRTDIVYYNTSFFEGRDPAILDALRTTDLKWVVTRHQSVKRRMQRQVPNLKARKWVSYKKPNFIGIGFAMRHILFDLALFADRPVSVFGADFYLGQQTHYKGYFDEGITVCREFARHDPFDTFIFLKALSKSGAIQPDKILSDILSASIGDFAASLSDKFAR